MMVMMLGVFGGWIPRIGARRVRIRCVLVFIAAMKRKGASVCVAVGNLSILQLGSKWSGLECL